jgi:hypothetical protein
MTIILTLRDPRGTRTTEVRIDPSPATTTTVAGPDTERALQLADHLLRPRPRRARAACAASPHDHGGRIVI